MKTKQERTEIFKLFQTNIKKNNTFDVGKQNFFELRAELAEMYDYIFETCSSDDFCRMPLAKDKTIAYYIYHLMRIEDIVSNTLIAGKEQVFLIKKYDERLCSPIITTGNEISRDKLIEFSKKLDINQLKNYATDVLFNTNNIVKNMDFENSKTKISEEKRADLLRLNSVSMDENAFWLIDYWCNKTHTGLLLMPFSRHQMLHLDGCLRIMHKIKV